VLDVHSYLDTDVNSHLDTNFDADFYFHLDLYFHVDLDVHIEFDFHIDIDVQFEQRLRGLHVTADADCESTGCRGRPTSRRRAATLPDWSRFQRRLDQGCR
jgi:hypothetical protein